jgi:hypothetical protein
MSNDPEQSPKSKVGSEMVRVLEKMLAADDNITARAVARQLGSIRHASSITRHHERSELLARYQATQKERRNWLERLPKHSKVKTAAEMAKKDERISELERQVEVLRASHVAMIRAVGELGGMPKFLRFSEAHRDFRKELEKAGVTLRAEVRQVKARSTDGGDPE